MRHRLFKPTKAFSAITLCLAGLLPFLAGSAPAAPLIQDDWLEPGERQPVTNLSFDGREFAGAFNAAEDRARLVIVFSPT